jgi:Protein kinase domain
MTECEIFIGALQRDDAAARRAYLAAACGADSALRARLDELLSVHDRAASFLESPVAGPAVTADLIAAEGPGSAIGPYKLIEPIGEGGFGAVFLAEQTQPVRRKVALKVLKPGMDSRQVIARFEAERQALALMDHPNIARVFDGGATTEGRPYFVMELVKGVPITDFCDQNQLPPRDRLNLFVQVCQAVQHAHQKAVIHRDLKPSNVLVSRHDTTPVVKVIDFGVAKALGQGLTDKTLVTGLAQMVGTPLYMSPEQAGMSDLDGGYTERHLLARGAALRTANRDHAVHQGEVPGGRVRRDPPDHPGRGPAEAEHADQHLGPGGGHSIGQPRPAPELLVKQPLVDVQVSEEGVPSGTADVEPEGVQSVAAVLLAAG